MTRTTIVLAGLLLAAPALARAQTTPGGMSQPLDPAQPTSQSGMTSGMGAQQSGMGGSTTGVGTTGAGESSRPRCSASVRDGCVQDQRFEAQEFRPSNRDNNAMHYRGKRTPR